MLGRWAVMDALRRMTNNELPGTWANRNRLKRFRLFRELVESLEPPIRLLDVGGTQVFWERMQFADASGVTFTLANINEVAVDRPNFKSIKGDARSLSGLADKEFDIVFSNSVIEHVGTFNDQLRMAAEIHRVGMRYFVQTPNRYFPIEPHFLMPFFQFYPNWLRVWLVKRLDLGWYSAKLISERDAIESAVNIRLLSRRELKRLFPDAVIYKERLLGLAKSFVAYGGAWSIHPRGSNPPR